MANKLPSLIAFLLLLAFQEMMLMRGEAAMCEANSKLFEGACFSSKNCGSICEKEGFTGGECKFWKCVCLKDCGRVSGTTAQGPPFDMPIEGPPTQGQPEQGPPTQEQPGEGPPTQEQPGEGPPTQGQPGQGPPTQGQPGQGPPTQGQPEQGPPTQEQPGGGPPGEERPPVRQSRFNKNKIVFV